MGWTVAWSVAWTVAQLSRDSPCDTLFRVRRVQAPAVINAAREYLARTYRKTS